MGVDLLQQSLAQLVPLQEMAEVQDGGLVRQGFRQVQAHEAPDRFGLIEQVLHAGVAEIVEQLHAVNPQHHRQRVGTPALASLGINRTDTLLQFLPRNQAIHPLQEQLAAGLAFFALVFQVSKSRLVHQFSLRKPPAVPAILCHNLPDLFRDSLDLTVGGDSVGAQR